MEPAIISQVRERFSVSDESIAQVMQIHKEKREPVPDILVRKQIVDERDILALYSERYHLPVVHELDIPDMDVSFTELINIQFLKKFTIVPLSGSENNSSIREALPELGADAIVLINDPTHLAVSDDLAGKLGLFGAATVLAPKELIISIINSAFDRSRTSAQELVEDLTESGADIISEIEDTADLLDDVSDAPIIKLVNHIISQSTKARASDIHIEPYQDSFKVRYRVDGILYDLLSPPKWIQAALISRIKVMAKLNIAEKRLPQDGRIEVRIGNQDVDIRVSTVPTTFGERVVMRLLNKTASVLSLSEFGLSQEKLDLLHRLIHTPNGIILVTGPTGSGKTTTLYAILSEINRPDINIITIEDPVEYQLKGIGQIQVNRKIDLTFARGLRSIVRQDPDVILVGEIRDGETAEISIQSALTGHLVFSTLHTNDAPSAVTRLVDIGTEPFLISSAVKAVIAQRLVRVLCNACKDPVVLDDTTLKALEIEENGEHLSGKTIYKAKGCRECFGTGFMGRMPIFEIMMIDDDVRRVMLETHDSNRIKKTAIKNGMVTLRWNGIQKVLEGHTTVAEVLRVTHN